MTLYECQILSFTVFITKKGVELLIWQIIKREQLCNCLSFSPFSDLTEISDDSRLVFISHSRSFSKFIMELVFSVINYTANHVGLGPIGYIYDNYRIILHHKLC